MYLLSLEWFKYAKCFVGVLACNGFDVAKYIYIYVCMYVCMYVCVFFILAKRKQIRKLLWTRFFVQIGECPLLPLNTKIVVPPFLLCIVFTVAVLLPSSLQVLFLIFGKCFLCCFLFWTSCILILVSINLTHPSK